MVLNILRIAWRLNVLLSEEEIRVLINRERDFMEDIVDPVDRKCTGAFIAGLECALNE